MKRREFLKPLLGATLVSATSSGVAALARPTTTSDAGKTPEPAQSRPEIAMLLYPGLTFLDLMGPFAVLGRMTNVHLVWKNTDLLTMDMGLKVQPDCTFADCPAKLDAIFVGGGPGLLAVMQDPACMEFLSNRGAQARFVTSVCTGSLALGAAGLLRGYRATSHWAYRDLLPLFGAEPVNERVVVDRNRISGGGVTAGIDFGLTLLSLLVGERAAKSVQLAIEYDPKPPFDAGTPEKAGPATTQAVKAQIAGRVDAIREFAGGLHMQT
jgi:putative intracellular protease/amidase